MQRSQVLPPKLQGRTRALLEVGCDSLVLKSGRDVSVPLGVYLLWWGQDPDMIHVLNAPVTFGNRHDDVVKEEFKGVRMATYKVVTGMEHFRSYLKDSKRLIMEIRDANDDVIGITAVQGLEKVVDSGAISQNVEIVSPGGNVIGFLSCYITLDAISSSSSSLSEKRKPLKVSIDNELEMDGSNSKKALENIHKPLPSWNLTTDQLKYISEMNQFYVKLKRIDFKPEVFDMIHRYNKEKSTSTKFLRKRNFSSKTHSYFVSYSVPPDQETFHQVSSKKGSRTCKNYSVEFQGQTVHRVTFNPKLLDTWWISNIEFKVLLRSLNQKTPNLVGSSFIGMKYILMDSQFSGSFKSIKIPIYSSTPLQQYALNAKETIPEIIGDLELEFCLKKESSKAKSKEKIVEAEKDFSKPPEARKVEEKVIKKVIPSTPKLLPSGMCLLRVSEGKGFYHEMPSTFCKNCNCLQSNSEFYVTCKLFHPDKHATSELRKPQEGHVNFDLQHSWPFPARETFLKKYCKENYLILEVWSQLTYDKVADNLVGLAMISLDPIFLAFKDQENVEMVKSLDLPVIVFNGWVEINDVVSGKSRGELRVLLAAGFENQIHKLSSMIDSGQCLGKRPDQTREQNLECQDQITEKCLDQIPEQCSKCLHETLEQCPSHNSKRHPGKCIEQCREQPDRIPRQRPDQTTDQAPDQIPEECSKCLHRTLEQCPSHNSKQHLGKRFEQPDQTPQQCPDPTSEPHPEHPDQITEQSSDQIPEECSKCLHKILEQCPSHNSKQHLGRCHKCSDHTPRPSSDPTSEPRLEHPDQITEQSPDQIPEECSKCLHKILEQCPSHNSKQHLGRCHKCLDHTPRPSSDQIPEQHLEGRDQVQKDECLASDTRYDSVADDEDSGIKLQVKVSEGRNFPRISTKKFDDRRKKTVQVKSFPNTYVTLPPYYSTSGPVYPTSKLVFNDCHPKWDMDVVIDCPESLLTDPRRHLIVKVWHRPDNKSTDHVLGFGAVDLTPLIRKEFTNVCGWYNIIDFVGRVRGQIKVEVTPDPSARANLEGISEVEEPGSTIVDMDSTYEHVSVVEDDTKDNEVDEPSICRWNPPDDLVSDDQEATYSILQDKLSDLDVLSQRLKGKLNISPGQPTAEEPPAIEHRTLEDIQSLIGTQLDAMKGALLQNIEENQPLDDLGEIDWDRVLGSNDSRMEPDGGNPSTAE